MEYELGVMLNNINAKLDYLIEELDKTKKKTKEVKV